MENTKLLFARNLRECRRAAGLSQVALGEKISYTGKAVSKWESGSAMPPADVLPALAAALNTDLNALFAPHDAPSLFLGIDGGGTKTHFALADREGRILRETVLGPCNPLSVGMDAACAVLREGILAVCGDLHRGRISVYAGIAGGGVGENRDILREFLSSFRFARVDAGRDAENIIAAGLGDRDGVAAILGTGSVVFAVKGSQRLQIGGYGHLLGDCFSGCEFGRFCLRAAFAEMDGSGPANTITPQVITRLGNEISPALARIYAEGKSTIASLAPLFFEAAEAGDPPVLDFLRESIDAFAGQLTAALRHFSGSTPIVLAGGITRYRGLFLEELRRSIHSPHPFTVEILESAPVVGAIRLAGGNIHAENRS